MYRLTDPPQQLTFENTEKIHHRSRLQCKATMAPGTYWKLKVLYHAVYKKVLFFSLSICLFLPGQGSLGGWAVSASGNNAFKVAFIRWTLKKKTKKKEKKSF